MVETTEINLVKQNFFKVTWAGTEVPNITDVTIPSWETETADHETGKPEHKNQMQGRLQYGDLQLTQDLAKDAEQTLMEAFHTARRTADTGSIKKSVEIIVQDQEENADKTYTCEGCWVREVSLPQLDAQSTEIVSVDYTISVDKMTVA
jgi:phage tail-like protein